MILLGAGLVGFSATVFSAVERGSLLGAWILSEVLTPQRILPIVALGVAFGMMSIRALGAGFLLLGLGMIAGFAGQYWLLWLLDKAPHAATHLFFTNPICYLAAGLALISGARLRTLIVPACAAIFGAMFALLVQLTDPSLHEPAFTAAPILIAVWIMAAAVFIVRAFWRDWFPVFARILGSWMLAIGLLYGGVSVAPARKPPTLPPPPSAPDNTIPGRPLEPPYSVPDTQEGVRQP